MGRSTAYLHNPVHLKQVLEAIAQEDNKIRLVLVSLRQ